MEEQEKVNQDWRENITEPGQTLKILDGERKKVVFIDNGTLKSHPDFGTSIVFRIEYKAEPMNWYVKSNNFSLLGQIKSLGDLIGKVVFISRKGATRSNTRYTVEEVKIQD